MRGPYEQTQHIFSYLSSERPVPADRSQVHGGIAHHILAFSAIRSDGLENAHRAAFFSSLLGWSN